jgi:hypothetical protein
MHYTVYIHYLEKSRQLMIKYSVTVMNNQGEEDVLGVTRTGTRKYWVEYGLEPECIGWNVDWNQYLNALDKTNVDTDALHSTLSREVKAIND